MGGLTTLPLKQKDMIDAYLIPLKQKVKVKRVFDNYYKAYNENGYIGTFFVDNIVFN